jgi:hypothetical protein
MASAPCSRSAVLTLPNLLALSSPAKFKGWQVMGFLGTAGLEGHIKSTKFGPGTPANTGGACVRADAAAAAVATLASFQPSRHCFAFPKSNTVESTPTTFKSIGSEIKKVKQGENEKKKTVIMVVMMMMMMLMTKKKRPTPSPEALLQSSLESRALRARSPS